MKLSELQTGQAGHIARVLGHGGFRKRIMEMGFVRGQRVEVLLDAPLSDPIKYRVMGYEVSLRRVEAAMIEVVADTETQAAEVEAIQDNGSSDDGAGTPAARESIGRHIEIALVGNPNSGKSSLYNALTGGHEHVGNYGGVTVGAKKGEFRWRDYRFTVYDLPGTYALSPYTPEELYVRRHLTEQIPDVVVNVAAASNLERNLYLTTELIDIDQEMVIALNMYDELAASGARLDTDELGVLLGTPVVPVVARDGEGLDRLLETIVEVYEHRNVTSRHIHINHGAAIESAVAELRRVMAEDFVYFPKHFSKRYLILKFLERDRNVERLLAKACPHYAEWVPVRDREAAKAEKTLGEDIESAITDEKYGFIAGALRETLTPGREQKFSTTTAIDAIVTHKLWGYPIFFALMWLMFELTFSVGQYPMDWIEGAVGWLSGAIGGLMPEGPLRDLLVDGMIGGVGSVIVFMPNILILFMCISFMEDSGYMARAAFIMDKVMHRIGLHGKSFIPLVMGFGCNVPGIMAARAIESRSSRIITVLISPFISCSARLPIYILLTGAFFPERAGLVLTAMYLVGIVVAAGTALLMRHTMFKRDDTPFVMELPPYRLPTLRTIWRHTWNKGGQYLRKMGGVILAASVVVWMLSYYPRGEESSYLERAGVAIEPVMRPLGIPWEGGVALVAGVGAKEITVSTLGVLYARGGEDAAWSEVRLPVRMARPDLVTGVPDWTPLAALSFMVFALLYFPCLAALGAMLKETGSWRWVVFSVVYNTAVAWLTSWAVWTVGGIFFN
ncbi:MAG: ferrous iron transport protein B [Alistipes sp.]|jgi:ferrous iron transport protein B|nr:ferrous iron transport protein B [Alistipes sp.]